MSNQLGMNVAAVRADAGRMEGIADSLAALASTVNACVSHLSNHWLGEDAHQLTQDWQYRDREAVNALSVHVRELARIALANADEQDRASGAGTVDVPGSASGLGSGGFVTAAGQSRTWLDPFEGKLGVVNGVLDVPGDVKNLHALFEADPWTKALTLKGDKAAQAGTALAAGLGAGAVSALHVSPSLVAKGKTVLGAGGHVIGTSGRVLGVVGAGVTLATKSVDAVDDFGRGDTSAGVRDVADIAAAGLKAGPPPVYLAGVVVAEWTDVSEAAEQVDWSTPPPAPTWSNLTTLYAPAFGDAVKSLPGHMWKWVS